MHVSDGKHHAGIGPSQKSTCLAPGVCWSPTAAPLPPGFPAPHIPAELQAKQNQLHCVRR